jgi:hypothetical protein
MNPVYPSLQKMNRRTDEQEMSNVEVMRHIRVAAAYFVVLSSLLDIRYSFWFWLIWV